MAGKGDKRITAQASAFAPNAGGQEALALRIGDDNHEFGLFKNPYLISDGEELYGVLYDWRYAACDSTCWVPSYFQMGFGLTNATPIVEIGWSLSPLQFFRVDFMTHLFLNVGHMASWSYPLWAGISVPM